jgi:SAM-dependent methyltransferase
MDENEKGVVNLQDLPPVFFEIHQDMEREAPGRDKYTRQAFEIIPPLEKPLILDIGCGPGGATRELARLSSGFVTGLDFYFPYLSSLKKEAADAALSSRIGTVRASMDALPFKAESFDILWAEGAIYIIGFEHGLLQWRPFLRPRGYLAVHEMTWLQDNPPEEIADYWKAAYPGITTISANLRQIEACGYELTGHFPLPEDAWWEGYYGPLEKRLKKLREKYHDNQDALAVIEEEQKEIDLYRKYNQWYGSVFYIMRKAQ